MGFVMWIVCCGGLCKFMDYNACAVWWPARALSSEAPERTEVRSMVRSEVRKSPSSGLRTLDVRADATRRERMLMPYTALSGICHERDRPVRSNSTEASVMALVGSASGRVTINASTCTMPVPCVPTHGHCAIQHKDPHADAQKNCRPVRAIYLLFLFPLLPSAARRREASWVPRQ